MSTSYGSSRRYISPQRSRPDTSHRHDHYDATSRDDRYDSRYRQQHPSNSHHHHHISSSNAYESEAASRREPRRRRSWPPQPYVEDEEDVVHRETGWSKRRVRQHLRTPVPFRGSIDQESVLEYALPPPQASSKASTDSRASRSDTNKTSSTSHSEDERTRRRQQEQQQQPSQKPPINLSDVVPEMRDRRSSPYTFSKKAQPDTNILDLERTRSPEAIVYASDASKRPVIRSGLGTESRPIPPEPLQRAHSTKDERYRGNHTQLSDPAYGSSAQYQQQRTSDKSSGDYHKPRDSVFDSSDARQLPIRVDRDKHDANENLQRQHAPSQPVRSNTSDQDAERNRNNEFLRKTESLPQRTFGLAAGSAVFASMNDAQIEPHRHAHGGLRSRTPEISNPHTKKTPPRSPRASGDFSSGRSATGSLNSSQLRSRAPSPALITNSHMITSMPYVEFDQDPLLANLFPAAPDLPYDPIPGNAIGARAGVAAGNWLYRSIFRICGIGCESSFPCSNRSRSNLSPYSFFSAQSTFTVQNNICCYCDSTDE
ncbi:uncharacterized protein K489DRAFT_262952 [Dissoconium aciculare CBS 342.82]|uniref:Uncharacterized protein n=1 Tax=Dissoconium aciculare CBS 342.82 TaxID=1314786 RepID=A0A6J3M0J1_9PEZI|nr:uncharacterized protein K489DRAFT_262952 [Dissoconium aciculare CBS 342.82]KAF1821014.1 hypothetical protein K489DRAFT_262952 [Dissoconium aciculare CBS 342.82]